MTGGSYSIKPPTVAPQTLEPLQPGELPTVQIDPAYQNTAFGEALAQYIENKKAALQAARAAREAAGVVDTGAENLKKAVIGAGALYLLVKFVL